MRRRNSPDWQSGEDERRPVGTIAYHTAAIIGSSACLSALSRSGSHPYRGCMTRLSTWSTLRTEI
jgi:hypothetical protein